MLTPRACFLAVPDLDYAEANGNTSTEFSRTVISPGRAGTVQGTLLHTLDLCAVLCRLLFVDASCL